MKFFRKVLQRISLPTPKVGKIIAGAGAILGLGGGAAISNQITLTNDLLLDVIIIVAITVITIVSGAAQVPQKLKDQL